MSLGPHLRDTGSSSGTIAGVMLDFRQFEEAAFYSQIRASSLILLASKFNLPSGLSFSEKTKSEDYREPATSKCSLLRRVEWSCNFFGQNCIYGSCAFVALSSSFPYRQGLRESWKFSDFLQVNQQRIRAECSVLDEQRTVRSKLSDNVK